MLIQKFADKNLQKLALIGNPRLTVTIMVVIGMEALVQKKLIVPHSKIAQLAKLTLDAMFSLLEDVLILQLKLTGTTKRLLNKNGMTKLSSLYLMENFKLLLECQLVLLSLSL